MDFILTDLPKLKQGLALGLLSKGLFYIRAMHVGNKWKKIIQFGKKS